MYLISMTDFFIQIFRRFMFWTPSSIFIEETHMKYENNSEIMHWACITISLANYTFIILNQKSTQMH